MQNHRSILIVAMGLGGLASLMRKLESGLHARGLSPLIWVMGGGDGGIDLLRAEGLAAFAPLRDDQILHQLDRLPAEGYAPEHPRMEFYRAFEQGSIPETRVGAEGLALIARWGMHIRSQANELLDLLRPSVLLVQSGVRLIEGALADLARERNIPLLFLEKGAFGGTVLIDDRGVGPLSLYGDTTRWDLECANDLSPDERSTLDDFRRHFRTARSSAWEQPVGGDDLRELLGLSAGRQVLFVPGQVRHDANTVLYSPRFSDNESFLRFLLAASEGLDLFILAKPHPMERRKESHLGKLLEGRGAWLPELNIHDALETAGLVACLNSTVGLEALIYGKPVISGARAFWGGKGFSFDLLDSPDPGDLRVILSNAPTPDAARLDPFLHHLLTRGSYGEPPGPWPDMNALAARLAEIARPADGGDFDAALRWMEATELESLRRENDVETPANRQGLLPFFA